MDNRTITMKRVGGELRSDESCTSTWHDAVEVIEGEGGEVGRRSILQGEGGKGSEG